MTGLMLVIGCVAMTSCVNHCACVEITDIQNFTDSTQNSISADSVNIDTRDDCASQSRISDTIYIPGKVLITHRIVCD